MKHVHPIIIFVLCWTVTGVLHRITDGDTFVASLNIWQQVWAVEKIRVLGINTPEKKDRAEWGRARDFTEQWLQKGQFTVHSCKRDSFGRVLGEVYRSDGSLAAELLNQGFEKWER